VAAFNRKFEETVAATITDAQLTPNILIDAEIEFEAISQKFTRVLKQFQPFGPQNMHPVFLTRRVQDTGYAKPVGKCGEHLRLEVFSSDHPDVRFPAIGFQLAEHYPTVRAGQPFDICYTVEENTFKGRTYIQLFIKDIRASEN
jgi:single-stranded-DNA-specific exonuclease